MIFDNTQPKYSVLDLGFDKSLVKVSVDGDLELSTPELANVFTSGVTPKNLLAGELLEFVDTGQAGVSGLGDLGSDIRFWAGESFNNRKLAPFRINQFGEVELSSLNFTRQFVMSFFESLDGWTSLVGGSGVNTVGLGNLYLRTGATINSKAGIANDNLTIFPLNLQNKNSFFGTVLSIPLLTGSNFDSYFAIGELLVGDDTDEGYGFRVTNDVLYAFVEISGVQTTDTITGITLGNVNTYLARNDASANLVTFYVNGILRATLSANYNGGGSDKSRFLFYITNTVATNREMYINHAIFAQDN